MVINFSIKASENSGINNFRSVRNSLEVLDKLQAYTGDFESIQNFDFLLYITHYPIMLLRTKSHT